MAASTHWYSACSTAALLIGSLAPIAAHAEAADAKTDIIVTARRADAARVEQLQAVNLVNIQSAETIAKYPDINAAEAISRVPGVSLSIDTAEGRFVNIRGLDGNFNGATFGGVVLLNTQPGGTYFNSAGRAVEFDTVPIGAIDRLSVIKTGLPDHEAEGIGGSVEMTPRTAIGRTSPFAEVTLGGGIETERNKGFYRDEVVIGAPFGGKNASGDAPFSFVLSQFLYNDKRGFDDIEAAYIDDQPNTPDKAFDALELRRYQYNRKRFGYSGELDFTPNADNRIYARASFAGYNETVHRNRLEIDGLADGVVVDPANANGFVVTGASTVKTLRNEDEAHRNLVVQVGGDHHFDSVTFNWFGAFSRATYDKYYDYNTTFAGPSGLGITYDNTTDPNHPKYTVTGADIADPANYTLDGISNSTEHDRDREWSASSNLAMPLGLTADDELKFGSKLRFREKTAMPLNYTYSYNGPALGLAGYAQGAPITSFYNAYAIGPDLDGEKLTALLNDNAALFDRSKLARDLSRNAGGYFDDKEDVIAGFAQYKGTFGALGLLAGLRVEHTSARYAGIAKVTDAQGAVSFVPASTTHTYTNAFPTVQLKYTIAKDFVARATWSTGIARPGFYQTIQSSSVDVGGGTVSTGNPNLQPMTSNNFDLAVEYYLPGSGIIAFGAFDKELRNYIVTRTTRGRYPGISGIATLSTYSNVGGAHARGIEASFVDKFTGLPGLLNGFGVDANATYVDAKVDLRDGEGSVELPGTFKFAGNAAVFYEHGPVKARVSAQYESKVLFGVGGSRATDVFQDHRFTLDFNGSYDVNSYAQLYFNAKNLTNAPLRFYEGTVNRPIQREYYDATFEGGIKLKF